MSKIQRILMFVGLIIIAVLVVLILNQRTNLVQLPRLGNVSGSKAPLVKDFPIEEDIDVPVGFTCDGGDMSPPFTFTDIPPETNNIAIIIKDLDIKQTENEPFAGVHFMSWNIDPKTTSAVQGNPPTGTIGRSFSGNFKYAGPCPPKGKTHRYLFGFYALDAVLPGMSSDATLTVLERAMKGHVIAKQEIVARYRRP